MSCCDIPLNAIKTRGCFMTYNNGLEKVTFNSVTGEVHDLHNNYIGQGRLEIGTGNLIVTYKNTKKK